VVKGNTVKEWFVPLGYHSTDGAIDASFISLKSEYKMTALAHYKPPNTIINITIEPMPKFWVESGFDVFLVRIPSRQLRCTPIQMPLTVSLQTLTVLVNDVPLETTSAATIRAVAFFSCLTAQSVTCAMITQSSVLSSAVVCSNSILRASHSLIKWIISPFFFLPSFTSWWPEDVSALLFSVSIVLLSFGVHIGLVEFYSKRWGKDEASTLLLYPNITIFIALLLYPGIVSLAFRTVFNDELSLGALSVVLYCIGGLPVVLYCYHISIVKFPVAWLKFAGAFAKETVWWLPEGGWIPHAKRKCLSIVFDDFDNLRAQYLCYVTALITMVVPVIAIEVRSFNACRLQFMVSAVIYGVLLYIFVRFRPFSTKITSILASLTLFLLIIQICLQFNCLSNKNDSSHWCDRLTNGVSIAAAVVQLIWGIYSTFVMVYTQRFLYPMHEFNAHSNQDKPKTPKVASQRRRGLSKSPLVPRSTSRRGTLVTLPAIEDSEKHTVTARAYWTNRVMKYFVGRNPSQANPEQVEDILNAFEKSPGGWPKMWELLVSKHGPELGVASAAEEVLISPPSALHLLEDPDPVSDLDKPLLPYPTFHEEEPLWLQRATYQPSKPVRPLYQQPPPRELGAFERMLFEAEKEAQRSDSGDDTEEEMEEFDECEEEDTATLSLALPTRKRVVSLGMIERL